MKKIMFLLILYFTALCSGCKKEDLTDAIDITQFSWLVKNISIEENKIKVKKDDYFNNKAYVLIFENDSIFQLNTSVNLAKGSFKISSKGHINIFNYQEITEVGSQNEIDDKLLKNIPSVSSYQVLNDDLILKGYNCEIELKKE